MQLMQVRAGEILRLPDPVHGPDRLWARPGAVFDFSDPYIARAVKGQEFKFEPASDESALTTLHAKVEGLIRRWKEQDGEIIAKNEPVQAAIAKAKESGLSTGIQPPDERPKAPKKGAKNEAPVTVGGAQSA